MARNSKTGAGSSSSNNSSSDNSTVPVSTPTTVSPASTTSTSTSTSFPTPSNHVLPLNCPAINNTQYNTENGSSFIIYCQTDFKSSTGNVRDLLQASVDECIEACVEYSLNNTDAPCHGMTFGANLTE